MRCSRVRAILMDYVAEELPERISVQVREHLSECADCRAELETARKSTDLLTLLEHQEEPQGVIRMPSTAGTAACDLPWWRSVRFRVVGAVILVIAVCIVGLGVLRLSKHTTPVVRVERPTSTERKSPVQVLPDAPKQQPGVADTSTKPKVVVREPEPDVRRAHRTRVPRNDYAQSHSPEKPDIRNGKAQPVQAAVTSPSDLLHADELPEGAMMMVSATWSSGSGAADDSYAYQYKEYDSESGRSVECRASRQGKSVVIQMKGRTEVR